MVPKHSGAMNLVEEKKKSLILQVACFVFFLFFFKSSQEQITLKQFRKFLINIIDSVHQGAISALISSSRIYHISFVFDTNNIMEKHF